MNIRQAVSRWSPLFFAALLLTAALSSEQVPVRHTEGLVHGFLTLRTLNHEQPPDTHVWILEGEAPAFVKMEGPVFVGGPIWRIELASPEWPKGSEDSKDEKSQQ